MSVRAESPLVELSETANRLVYHAAARTKAVTVSLDAVEDAERRFLNDFTAEKCQRLAEQVRELRELYVGCKGGR